MWFVPFLSHVRGFLIHLVHFLKVIHVIDCTMDIYIKSGVALENVVELEKVQSKKIFNSVKT